MKPDRETDVRLRKTESKAQEDRPTDSQEDRPMTYLLLSSSMVVVISSCRASSNLLFWDLFLLRKAQPQSGARQTDGHRPPAGRQTPASREAAPNTITVMQVTPALVSSAI
jgi:hypothetical protein